jgi:hypothetical protein
MKEEKRTRDSSNATDRTLQKVPNRLGSSTFLPPAHPLVWPHREHFREGHDTLVLPSVMLGGVNRGLRGLRARCYSSINVRHIRSSAPKRLRARHGLLGIRDGRLGGVDPNA